MSQIKEREGAGVVAEVSASDFVAIKDIAAEKGFSVQGVYRAIQRGSLKSLRIGGHIVVTRTAANEWNPVTDRAKRASLSATARWDKVKARRTE